MLAVQITGMDADGTTNAKEKSHGKAGKPPQEKILLNSSRTASTRLSDTSSPPGCLSFHKNFGFTLPLFLLISFLRATSANSNDVREIEQYVTLPQAVCDGVLIQKSLGRSQWECRRECSARGDGCGAWSFSKDAGICDLFISCERKVWSPGYESGQRSRALSQALIPPVTYVSKAGYICRGSLLKRAWTTLYQECQDSCTGNSMCKAFSHKSQAQLCETFSTCDTTTEDALFSSGVKNVLPDVTAAASRRKKRKGRKDGKDDNADRSDSSAPASSEEDDSPSKKLPPVPIRTSKPLQTPPSNASYNRTYIASRGARCKYNTKIRNFKCGKNKSEQACKDLCQEECDGEKDCLAFMTLKNGMCRLFSECGVISMDAAQPAQQGSQIHYCVTNCPVAAESYVITEGNCGANTPCDCDSGNRIAWFDPFCEEGNIRCAFNYCAEKCKATAGCADFAVTGNLYRCELYTECNMDTHYDADEGMFIGSFRDSSSLRSRIDDQKPWIGCGDESSGWWELGDARCINWNRGPYVQIPKGTSFADDSIAYLGSWDGCQDIAKALVMGEINTTELMNFTASTSSPEYWMDNSEEEPAFARGDYVTFSQFTRVCSLYKSPANRMHGCVKWQGNKPSDRLAMYCGLSAKMTRQAALSRYFFSGDH